MPKLEIIAGANAQHQFLVEKVGVWIGSDERCDISLQEPGISKFHAQIILDPSGSYWIEDAGSSFGTLLNGKDVERDILRHDDIVTLGRLKLRFVQEPSSEATVDPHFGTGRDVELHTQPNPALAAASMDVLYDDATQAGETETPAAGQPAIEVGTSPVPPGALESEGCEILDEEDDDEILDGDALELIEDSEYELDAADLLSLHGSDDLHHTPGPRSSTSNSDPLAFTPTQENLDKAEPEQSLWGDDLQPDQEGTALAPIPLSPDAFLRPGTAPTPDSSPESAQELPPPDAEGTRLTRMPLPPGVAEGPEPEASAEVIKVAKQADIVDNTQQPSPNSRESATGLKPSPTVEPSQAYTVNHDEEEDLHGSAPPPRSRTMLFNLELERLKFELQQRETQLQQMQEQATTQDQGDQHQMLLQTLEMVREDNQRLQYQITAYEEAADENEELMQRVMALEKANRSLHTENQTLREQLAQYERYYYQQQMGAADGSST